MRLITEVLNRIAGADSEVSFLPETWYDENIEMTTNCRRENDTIHVILYVCLGWGKFLTTSEYHDTPFQM